MIDNEIQIRKGLPGYIKIVVLITVACFLGIVAFAGITIYGIKSDETASYTEPDTDSAQEDTQPVVQLRSDATGLKVSTSDVSDIVTSVMPAVVSINCTVTYTSYDFWGDAQTYKGTSGGTGFFVSQSKERLFIATNNHVVDGADSIEITMADGASATAEVVGTAPDYDLAVISVALNDLSDETLKSIRIATLGDSDDIAVGSMSIAIGNALGYGQSTTVGYISALNRTLTVDSVDYTLIQTDAAINPGNSGGPLLNIYGQVIGINSVKFASSDVEGMGYAIPISLAIPVINDLVTYETIPEDQIGYLGIVGKDVSQTYAASFNMPVGVYVYKIESDSPARTAGLHEGDIITAINGRSVSTEAGLENRLSHIRAGETIELSVNTLLNGEYVERTVSVTLAKQPKKEKNYR